MGKNIEYLKYIARHKWNVYLEGKVVGLSLTRRILHDWQKLLPSEFIPYRETFYGDDKRPHLDSIRIQAWWQREKDRRAAFDRAWLHHQRTGTAHHWQAHLLILDDGAVKALEMPEMDRREMLADWRAMSRAFRGSGDAAIDWYEKNRETIQLAPETRAKVETELKVLRAVV